MKSKIKVSLDNLLFGFVHGHYNDHYVFVADFVVDDDDVEDDDDDDEEEEEEDLFTPTVNTASMALTITGQPGMTGFIFR
ncbi:hypothetical protein DPMN_053332 [Dreissena polymorpha]|uniref:Uncharacterized protein n=1 Tax=Dreissena polymorpha TaxID=45954 RepID=A0A9D4CL60_DREPO|nr:hypothetical protein DPMN_053332 [Dreissena polymorpha]